MNTTGTIAAISTPNGIGGIAVIRISGEDAFKIADKCFKSYTGKRLCNMPGYTATYGEICSDDKIIDDAVALCFKAPHSYTGENVVEISLHGGKYVAKKALRQILSCGATLAGPGEFTQRAFLNGKMDLASAEGVMGIISGENESSLRYSREVKDGSVTRRISSITDSLLKLTSDIAYFSDEPDDIPISLTPESFKSQMADIKRSFEKLICSYDYGKIMREGISTCIVGKPNVGKSSLMNMLCACNRSIVTDIAGTTRDVIEESVQIGDKTLRLKDTAGIHSSLDKVEQIGVKIAIDTIGSCDLVLAVFDGSSPLDDDDISLLKILNKANTLVIINKNDLDSRIDYSAFEGFKLVSICARESSGIDEISSGIDDILNLNNSEYSGAVLITERQRNCVLNAKNALVEAEIAFDEGCTLDAVGICLDDALNSLLQLIGKRATNEVCNEVFKRFCVGK